MIARVIATTVLTALFLVTMDRQGLAFSFLKSPRQFRNMQALRQIRMILRGGSPSPEKDSEQEPSMENGDDAEEFLSGGSKRAEAGGAQQQTYQRSKSKRYSHLPDEKTEMIWRLADMVLDRRGKGSRERHSKEREAGKRRTAKTLTLKKLQHGSKRQQQGATARNISKEAEEYLSFRMMLFSGTTSGPSARLRRVNRFAIGRRARPARRRHTAALEALRRRR